jgi:hypothetical protein
MIKRMLFLIIILLSSQAEASHSVTNLERQSIAVDYLIGENDLSGLRLAYRPVYWRLEEVWLLGDVDVYWEASFNKWEYGEDNTHQSNFALSLSPVLYWEIGHFQGIYPVFAEFGIGVSIFEDTEIAGKDVGSHYQFEDRLGVSVRFGESLSHSIGIRYMHYSNGGLNRKNPGLDFLNVAYVYDF